MKRFSIQFGLKIILAITSVVSQAQVQNGRIVNKREEIPVTILSSGHIFVPATINDTIKGNFVFDTGGGIELVSSAFFSRIEPVPKRTGTFSCFKSEGERVDLPIYYVANIKIGNFVKENVVVGIFPLLDSLGIDGLLSSKFIESLPVTIDFKKQVFVIENSESINEISKKGIVIPIFIQKHGRVGLDIFIDVSINDTISVLSEFDTGHGFYPVWINSYYKDFIENDSISNSISKLSLKEAEGLKILNQAPVFKKDLIYEGLIGTSIFKNGILSIDIQHERVIFQE